MHSDSQYLLSLHAIRERARIVGDVAQAGNLNHFDFNSGQMDYFADFVTSIIQVRSAMKSRYAQSDDG